MEIMYYFHSPSSANDIKTLNTIFKLKNCSQTSLRNIYDKYLLCYSQSPYLLTRVYHYKMYLVQISAAYQRHWLRIL